MRIFRFHCTLAEKELHERLDSLDAVAVDSIGSLEEAKLAQHLAASAFSKKKNIARQMRYEFLLWLSGKTDIKSAMKSTSPKGKEFFVVVFSESRDIAKKLDARELELGLKKDGEPLDLERVSLSRVRN